MPYELVEKVKRFDAQRPNIPGEHWLSFAAGIALWVATRRHPSGTVRLLAGIAGGLLVARAAAGRDVPQALQHLIPDTSWLRRQSGSVTPSRL